MEIFVVPDIWNVLAQWGATLILFLVIRHFVYRPMSEFLAKRQEAVTSDLQQAEDRRLEAEQLKAQYEEKIDDAKREGAEIVEESRKRAKLMEQRAAEDARAEARALMERAKGDIDREKKNAEKEVRTETADLAVLIAQKLLKENIEVSDQDRLVDGMIEELEKNHVR
ncbi:F-type ATPase subunit b [Aedoeadaptatus ivorii]|uniref:ATP synthase subunit b n=1 Tax=Aedoeadaptatus ivorii TaxID=54006 RepID=A0A448UZK4_9FIRM|nr:F0F1 ATP synthase subunit B [Peptoniphilus ivorii]MDQ0508559.1 F-type H+-transporting ATPase subunit b [Peptoniphilus ivorii]VEJ34432.1 F-type ATPase subunit b [Peptoniphilus ivorii]